MMSDGVGRRETPTGAGVNSAIQAEIAGRLHRAAMQALTRSKRFSSFVEIH
jgi:hypothetical protein